MGEFLLGFALKRARMVSIAICLGYLVAGLWPFNFLPANRLGWLPDRDGIRLGPLSIVYSQDVLDLRQNGSVSIELWLQSELDAARDVYPILSLFDGRFPENLSVAQWKSGLLIRTAFTDAEGRRKYREAGVASALPKGNPRFVAITSGNEGTSLYIDGVMADTYPRLQLQPNSMRGRLILGNSARGGPGWTGKLLGLAIYGKSLAPAEVLRDYRIWIGGAPERMATGAALSALFLFDEGGGRTIRDHSVYRRTLVIPEFYYALRKDILQPPWKGSAHLHDIAVNVLGFIPFGLFYFAHRAMIRQGRGLFNAGLTIVAAAIISAGIELTQVILPTRSSSLTDLICNVAGSAIGVLLAKGVVRDFEPSRLARKSTSREAF